MSEAVRQATDDDRAVLAELHRLATDELREQRGGELWARQTDRAAGPALGAPATAAWVGTIDDTVVGYAIARLDPLADGGRLAVLTDVYVLPDARGVGVGELLLDAVIAWATEAGAVGIDSVALPGMRDSKNFFESAGLVARAITVHRSLPRPSGSG
jgi:GNAT superfamily N-acetyltransferase